MRSTFLILGLSSCIQGNIDSYNRAFKVCNPNENHIGVFIGPDFNRFSYYYLSIEDGEFEYKDFQFLKVSSGEPILIDSYCTTKDSVKVYIQINRNDTTFWLKPSETGCFSFGSSRDEEFGIITTCWPMG